MVVRHWMAVLASLMPLVGCGDPRTPGAAGPIETAGSTQALTDPPQEPRRYYVDPRGSDSGVGSSTAPFRSIQRAALAAGPGDTVLVRPGVYTGSERIVSLTRSGTPAAWITFLSERKWKAVVDGRDGRSREGWYFDSGVAFVRVEGFEIKDLHDHAFDTYGGGVHDLVIAGNHVHHIGRNCTDTSNGRTGASLGAATRRVAFDGNVWHDIGRFAPGESGCSPKTAYYQNHDHGIYVADADEITITNNVFSNFTRGWAVHRYNSKGSISRGLVIANNTFVGENPYRPGQIILATSTSDLRIENNIFHSPRSAALYFENLSFPDGVVRYNMVSGGVMTVGRPTEVAISRNWERTNPRFVSSSDLRLSADSPAIDVGLPLAGVTHDANGVQRPRGRGYDLGAYER